MGRFFNGKDPFEDDFFKDFNDDSVNHFNKNFKGLTGVKPRSVFRGFFGLWFVGVLLGIGFWGTVIYIAVHFIGKFW
jgi:hypothetical protein